jgi:single-stranded DNA-binding protein
MSIDVLIQGRLRGTVTAKVSSNGYNFATFKLASTDENNEPMLCSCFAFCDKLIEQVLQLGDGDSVIVVGETSSITWPGTDGNPRTGLDIMVHAAVMVYHAGRKRDRKDGGT